MASNGTRLIQSLMKICTLIKKSGRDKHMDMMIPHAHVSLHKESKQKIIGLEKFSTQQCWSFLIQTIYTVKLHTKNFPFLSLTKHTHTKRET